MTLGTLDIAVLATYFVAILGVGYWFGRGEENPDDYFLGGRTQHWLVVGLSIIATEVSALTFVLVPAEAFRDDGRGDWSYLQLYAGAIVGRLLIVLSAAAGLLSPSYHDRIRISRKTVWAGHSGHRLAPVLRLPAHRKRHSPAGGVTGDRGCLSMVGYARCAGGGRTGGRIHGFWRHQAIIWTDGTPGLGFCRRGHCSGRIPSFRDAGSLVDILTTAHDTGQMRVFHWNLEINSDKAFWLLLVCQTLQNMAALGTDQDLTQRMLTCPDLRRGQRSLLFNLSRGPAGRMSISPCGNLDARLLPASTLGRIAGVTLDRG